MKFVTNYLQKSVKWPPILNINVLEQNNSLKSIIEELKLENKAINDEKSGLTQTIVELNNEINKLQEGYKEVLDKNMNQKDEIINLRNKNNNILKDKMNQKREINNLSNKNKKLIEKNRTNETMTQNKILNLENENDRFCKEIISLRMDQQEFINKIEVLNQENKKLESENKQLKLGNLRITMEKNSLAKTKSHIIKKNIEAISSKDRELTNLKKNQEAEKATLNNEIGTLKKKIEIHVKHNKDLSNEIIKIQQKNEKNFKDVGTMVKCKDIHSGQKTIHELIVDPNDYKEIKIIGRGRSGDVFLVQLVKTGKEFAKKVYFFNENYCSQNFLREVDIGANIDHPCVIELYGFCLQTENALPSIFYEYAKNGTLQDLINKRDPSFNSTRKALCALEICAGMSYLHSLEIIHRDLKPSNILVTDRMHFKISDFSDSKFWTPDSSMTTCVGTRYFQSPEIMNENKYDEKTDVYSFGSILFVLMTGDIPEIKLSDLINGKQVPIPSCISQLASDIIKACWSYCPNVRPSFDEIIEMMKAKDFMLFDDVDKFYLMDRLDQLNL